MSNFFKHKMRGKSPGVIAGWVILGVLGITGLAILFGFVIMWLWNWLMPELFGLTTLTYWQAVGLFILAKILFSSGGGGKSHHSSKHSRHSHRSCRHDSKKDFSKWKHYGNFWETEGNKAYCNYVERMEDEIKKEDIENLD